MLQRKGIVALSVLIAVILILTGTAARQVPRTPVLGELAPFLIVGLLTWYMIILIVERNEIISAIATLLRLGGQREWSRKGFWLTTVVYSVMLILVIVVLYVIFPQPLKRLQEIVQQISLSANTAGQNFEPSPIAGIVPAASFVYYTVAILAAIFLLSLILLFGGLRFAIKDREVKPADSDLEVEMDAVEVVQQAIAGLKSAREYHETILQCYKRMCMLLSAAGFGMAPAETAREFAETISTKLRIGAEAVKSLTFLFEEARYSGHEISEDKRMTALGHLESLERALSLKVGAGS